MATIEEFHALDLRVGTVLSAEPFPAARTPAYRLTIDFGPLGLKRSSAQITALYDPDDLVGRQVIAVVNLPPRRIAGFVSEVLVLGAVGGDGAVILLRPERPAANGDRVA
ncbi:MAG: tRNA-binding protein [Chloroflexi bacterium]|nr:tRNA-binding protein [Chloroflexota bacterium]